MSSDRLGILGETHQPQRENVQHQKKIPQTTLIASQFNLNREMWNLKPLQRHLVVLCSQSFVLRKVTDPLSHLLPLFLRPQGRQVWSNKRAMIQTQFIINGRNPYNPIFMYELLHLKGRCQSVLLNTYCVLRQNYCNKSNNNDWLCYFSCVSDEAFAALYILHINKRYSLEGNYSSAALKTAI